MYGSQEPKPDLKEQNYFTAGINQNVTINSEFRSPKKDGSGDKVICIDITGSNNEKTTVTEWPQTEDKNITNQLTRLRRWVKEVTGADTFPTQFNSFEDMATQFNAAVNGKETKLEIKLVYKEGSDKYLEMPKYDGCVRSMSNTSRLTLSAKEAERCIPKAAAPSTANELGEISNSLVDPNLDF